MPSLDSRLIEHWCNTKVLAHFDNEMWSNRKPLSISPKGPPLASIGMPLIAGCSGCGTDGIDLRTRDGKSACGSIGHFATPRFFRHFFRLHG